MSDVARLIEECGAITYGTFTLSDGSLTDYYVDKYVFETRPAVLDAIADEIATRLDDGIDVIAGPALGAVPLVTAVSLRTGVRGAFVRRGDTHHGTQARIEGDIGKGQRVAVVEDVTATGATIIEAAELVEETGGTVERMIVVVDRNEGADEAVHEAGYELEALVRVGENVDVDI